jgi:hypothetical protein
MDQILILLTSIARHSRQRFSAFNNLSVIFLERAALHKAHANAATAIFSFPPGVERSKEIDRLSADGDDRMARGRKPIAPQRPALLK